MINVTTDYLVGMVRRRRVRHGLRLVRLVGEQQRAQVARRHAGAHAAARAREQLL